MQVSLLKLNAGISRAVEAAGTLERQNADLETEIARLSSASASATPPPSRGHGHPAAPATSATSRARPGRDAALAARADAPPSDERAAR